MSAIGGGAAAQELNLLKLKWELAEEYINAANKELKDSNIGDAMELCETVLAVYPAYFPAIELKQKITDMKKSLVLQQTVAEDTEIDNFSSFESSSECENVDRRRAYVGCTPAPKKFLRSQAPPPVSAPVLKETKSCLKPVSSMTSQPLRKVNGDCSEKGVTWGVQQDRPLSERRLNLLLLEGYFFTISSVELFLRLKELWQHNAQRYVCPNKGCKMSSSRRLNVVDHYLNHHFSQHEGRRVLPFGCKTCEGRFESAQKLLQHASQVHPTCRWANQLRDVMTADD